MEFLNVRVWTYSLDDLLHAVGLGDGSVGIDDPIKSQPRKEGRGIE